MQATRTFFITFFLCIFSISSVFALTLTDSPPITATRDGQIIENVRIVAANQPAITVSGYSNVIIRNVEIAHEGAHGISCSGAPGITIENVSITHIGASSPLSSTRQNNINCTSSDGLTIKAVRLDGGSSGAWILNSSNAHVSFIEGYNFRGPFPRGQLIQFDKSPFCILEDFSVINEMDPSISWPEDNISVYKSDNCIVRRGLVDGNISNSGVGVMFEFSNNGLAEDIDTVRQGNGSFSAYPGNNVTFRRTRARGNFCGDVYGTGAPLSNSLVWAGSPESSGLKIEDSYYYDLCNPSNLVWDRSTFTTIEVSSADFTLRDPIVNVFPWEEGVSAGFTSSTSGLTANFTDTSFSNGGTVTGWFWEFGDGGLATTANPSHTYSIAGTYTVSLTVSDSQGASDSVTQYVILIVNNPNQPPTAEFTASTSGLTVNFNDASTDNDGTITSWSWNFGDGGVATSANPSYTYSAAGSYTVSLTVFDSQGASDSVAHTVNPIQETNEEETNEEPSNDNNAFVETMNFRNREFPDSSYAGTQDSFIRATSPLTNYKGDARWDMFADGSDKDSATGVHGEVRTVIAWDISSIPANAQIQSASLTFNVFDPSSGQYNLYEIKTPWDESTVNWNTLSGSNALGTTVLGSMIPKRVGETVITLNQSGVALVQSWVNGSIPNNGFVLRTGGTKNGVDIWTSEADIPLRPKLTVSFTSEGGPGEPDEPGDTTPPAITAPANVTVQSTGTLTPVDIGQATATDNLSTPENITIRNNAPAGFPLGITLITWTATDEAGNSSSSIQSITVQQVTTQNTMNFRNREFPDSSYAGTQDSFIRATSPLTNYKGGARWDMFADGSDKDSATGVHGEVRTVIAWDISSIPANAQIQSASLTFNVFDPSSGQYNLYEIKTPWDESTVNWNTFSNSNALGTTVLGSMIPNSKGERVITLNQSGVALVQGWVNGSIPNNGFVLRTGGTTDGVDIWTSEADISLRPKLTVSFTSGG